jgi:D-aminoacyl-tRNA deacylase
LLVFLAVIESDTDEIMEWFCNKIVNLRIFPDDKDKMNRSVLDINGGILLISNFTLYGDIKHGFRPSFTKAAPPEIAEPMYNKMLNHLQENYPLKVESGVFGAMMDIELVNAGPVTISIEKES